MARRNADQLQDHPEPYQSSERDRDHGAGRHFRRTAEERGYRSSQRDGQTAEEPGRNQRYEEDPGCYLRSRSEKERICVQEAHTLGIPLIGIIDTNCDPEELDYVIPGNDDAIRAVKLIVSKMADAVIEANQGTTEAEEAEVEEATEE